MAGSELGACAASGVPEGNRAVCVLLAAVAAGDRAAANALCSMCRPRLLALFACEFAGPSRPVKSEEDLVQEVQLAVWRRLSSGSFPKFESDADFWRVLRSIVHCVFVSSRRYAARRRRRPRGHAHCAVPRALKAIVNPEPALFEFEEELWEIVRRTDDDLIFAIHALLRSGITSPRNIARILNRHPRLIQRKLRQLFEAWRARERSGQCTLDPCSKHFPQSSRGDERESRPRGSNLPPPPPPPRNQESV